jgi:hypothetical protein
MLATMAVCERREGDPIRIPRIGDLALSSDGTVSLVGRAREECSTAAVVGFAKLFRDFLPLERPGGAPGRATEIPAALLLRSAPGWRSAQINGALAVTSPRASRPGASEKLFES